MTIIRFNLYGYLFEEGIKALRTGFDTAAKALLANQSKQLEELSRYQQSLEDGADPIGDWDDDGHQLWSQDQVITMNIELAGEALQTLRKTFVIALYHHWERSIRAATGCLTAGSHDQLASAARARGIEPHEKLNSIRDLVNTLKHDNDRWGLKLQASWSEIVRSNHQPSSQKTDWYETVQMEDIHVIQAFDIILASGPNALPPERL